MFKRLKRKKKRLKALDDFRLAEIAAVELMRFQMGYSVSDAALETKLPRSKIREIENAILREIQTGNTDRFAVKTVKAAKRMLKEKTDPDESGPANN